MDEKATMGLDGFDYLREEGSHWPEKAIKATAPGVGVMVPLHQTAAPGKYIFIPKALESDRGILLKNRVCILLQVTNAWISSKNSFHGCLPDEL